MAKREQALEQLLHQRKTLEHWQGLLGRAEAEHAELRELDGALVLDDPDAVDRIPRQLQELRDRIYTAERAVDTARSRVQAAESEYLLAEAEVLGQEVTRRRAKLDAHVTRLEELVQAVRDHEGDPDGVFLTKGQQMAQVPRDQRPEKYSYRTPASTALRQAVAEAERPVIVLREMAAGREPLEHPQLQGVNPVEVFPACVWGPDAVVRAPAYARLVERQEAEVAELRALAEQLPAEIEEWEAQQAAEPPGVHLNALTHRRTRLTTVGPELEAAEARLAELTSSGN